MKINPAKISDPFFKRIIAGDVSVFDGLGASDPQLTAQIEIDKDKYDCLSLVLVTDNLPLFKRLLAKTTDGSYEFPIIIELICSTQHKILRKAAAFSSIEIIKLLLAKNSHGFYEFPSLVHDLPQDAFFIFYAALYSNSLFVTNFFLNIPAFLSVVLDRIRQYEPKAQAYIQDYVNSRTCSLHKLRVRFELDNIGQVFDIGVDEAELFYVIAKKYVINDKFMEFNRLLLIPSIKALMHQNENALLRLAIKLGQFKIVASLIQIPAVLCLAEYHNFYLSDHVMSVLELRIRLKSVIGETLGTPRHLSSKEEILVEQIRCRYARIIQWAGDSPVKVLNEIRGYLADCYNKNPEFTAFKGRQEVVPLSWRDLQKFLEDDSYDEVQRKLFKNPAHSGYRYLLKPNPLIDYDFLYISVDPHQELAIRKKYRYSTFEQCSWIIICFWLLCKDAAIRIFDDESIERRKERIISFLAFLSRMHNISTEHYNNSGRFIGNLDFRQLSDDGKPDKPACFSCTPRFFLYYLSQTTKFDKLIETFRKIEP